MASRTRLNHYISSWSGKPNRWCSLLLASWTSLSNQGKHPTKTVQELTRPLILSITSLMSQMQAARLSCPSNSKCWSQEYLFLYMHLHTCETDRKRSVLSSEKQQNIYGAVSGGPWSSDQIHREYLHIESAISETCLIWIFLSSSNLRVLLLNKDWHFSTTVFEGLLWTSPGRSEPQVRLLYLSTRRFPQALGQPPLKL